MSSQPELPCNTDENIEKAKKRRVRAFAPIRGEDYTGGADPCARAASPAAAAPRTAGTGLPAEIMNPKYWLVLLLAGNAAVLLYQAQRHMSAMDLDGDGPQQPGGAQSVLLSYHSRASAFPGEACCRGRHPFAYPCSFWSPCVVSLAMLIIGDAESGGGSVRRPAT